MLQHDAGVGLAGGPDPQLTPSSVGRCGDSAALHGNWLMERLREPSPIVTSGGHVASFAQTENRLKRVVDLVPITRIHDEGRLDFLGLPTFSAVTPLAKDLTVHSGKGQTTVAARISAIMEAIERVSAESVDERRTVVDTFTHLIQATTTPEPMDPVLFDLPFETTYSPTRACSWVVGLDLFSELEVLVPVDMVISPPVEGIAVGVETNGLAAGNTYAEAVIHALYELIERSAISAEDFFTEHHDPLASSRLGSRSIENATLPHDARVLVQGIELRGRNALRVTVRQLWSTLGVPVFAVNLIDSRFPGARGGPVVFGGYGADLDPVRAVMRAITEAVQSRSAFLVSARDDFEGCRPAGMRQASLLSRLDSVYPQLSEPFPAGASESSGDLALDLQLLLSRLRSDGYTQCVVVPLTRRDLQIPVVRVLLPGAPMPYGDTARRPPLRLLKLLL